MYIHNILTRVGCLARVVLLVVGPGLPEVIYIYIYIYI